MWLGVGDHNIVSLSKRFSKSKNQEMQPETQAPNPGLPNEHKRWKSPSNQTLKHLFPELERRVLEIRTSY
jgi:hypothetical protein